MNYKLVLFTSIIGEVICGIIFGDEFNDLDNTKWKIFNKKSDCANVWPEVYSGCSTSNQVNLRFISGAVAITARQEKYFNSPSTTATLVSQQSFLFGANTDKINFKLRASLPTIKGLIPRVDLSPLVTFRMVGNINLVSFNGTLWNGIVNSDRLKNLTGHFDASEFNDYEIIHEQGGSFRWLMNKIEVHKQQITLSPFDRPYPYKIIITVEVDNELVQSEKIENNSCRSLLVDYLKIYQDNTTDDNNNISEIQLNKTSRQICTEIQYLEKQAYIKFNPRNYTHLMFQDEFDGNSLDQSKWLVKGINDIYAYYHGENSENDTSCKLEDFQNIKFEQGKLNLYLRKNKTERCNYTGTTITTKMCFNQGRIEIRAKLPLGNNRVFSFIMDHHKDSCYQGQVNGHVNILNVWRCDTCFGASMRMSGFSHLGHKYNATMDNFEKYQIYGIEWTKTSIQWFINDRVIYQANPAFDQNGGSIMSYSNRALLPFDHPFNFMINMAVQVHENNGSGLFKSTNLTSDYLDIDYIRIYGEEPLVPYSNKNETVFYQARTPYALIISINMVILVIVIIIIVVYLRGKSRTQNELDNFNVYDDIELHEEKYEEIQENRIDNDYEQVHFYDTYENISENEEDYLKIVKYKSGIYA